LGLQKLNHADAVKAHPDALIAEDLDLQPRLGLRRGSLPDLLMPDLQEPTQPLVVRSVTASFRAAH
jgi:hypothetical protein